MTAKRHGWSLFELMIITGLIAFLLVALAPALMDVRDKARSTVCKARLRSLAQHCQVHGVRTGYFPWGSRECTAGHDNAYCRPRFEMLYPLDVRSKYGIESWSDYQSNCWDFKKLNSDSAWKPGDMFDGAGISDVICCPCCAGDSDNWDGNRMTGYNYNVCFLGYVEGDRSGRNYPSRYSLVKFADKVVVFGDGGYSGGANKFMRAPKTDSYYDSSSASLRKAGTQAFRHGKGKSRHCNMAFLDGHVEEFRNPYQSAGKKGWVDERAHTAFISSGNGIYGPRGWGVPDDDTE